MSTPNANDRPAPAAPPPARGAARGGPVGWFLRGGWYPFVVVLSLGMLSFVPFLHAALRTRRPLVWLSLVVYAAAVVALFVLVGRTNVGGYALGLMIVASIHSLVLRTRVWSSDAPARSGAGDHAVDPAVAAVLAGRRRRDEARKIAATDPAMARELRIGRPDLPRSYDDGGLVDLAGAPPAAIAHLCGIGIEHAEEIARARAAGIAFSTVDDVLSVVDIPFPLWERIRDRGVVIPG
jgi:DNA uptake protein ComE-like DNA-binding protein